MLDVHPPHSATHSWKDFWIHLGTITAGLLIAIALEQSVEAVIRVHERHVLEAELHEETEQNDAILRGNLTALNHFVGYYTALDERASLSDQGTEPAKLPPLPQIADANTFLPSAGAWTAAKDSNQLALLPRNLASVYEELYQQRDFAINHFFMDWFDATSDYDGFVDGHTPAGGKFDPAALTAADRTIYETLLKKLLARTKLNAGTTQFWLWENEAVLHGVHTTEDLHRAVIAASNAH